MDNINVLDVIIRWIHLGSVIVLVGGAVFLRFVLLPAAAALTDAEHQLLRQRVVGRWKLFVHALIVLLLASGIYNIFARFRVLPVPLYHALLTVKIVLALFIFFVASALVGRSNGLAPMRAKLPFWLAVNITVAGLIVLLSNLMRFLPAKSG